MNPILIVGILVGMVVLVVVIAKVFGPKKED
jgi:hypothetical protein